MSTIKVTNLRHESAAGDNITLDSSGRVGIGTASPSSLLSVHEATASTANYINVTNAATGASSLSNGLLFGVTSSGAGLCWQNENLDFLFGTNNTERVRIDSSGRLLVGTSSTSSSSAAVFQGNSASSTADAIIRLARGTTSPANGDLLGTIIFTDSGHGDAAYFYAQRDGGTWNTSTSRPSRLVFSTTADGASSPTERMRIASTGALGLSGANYGTSGQVLTSQGSGSAPQWATPAGGKILQVKQKVITEVISYAGSSGTWAALTGFNESITPSSSSNKILVMLSVNFTNSNVAEHMAVRVKRGTTILGGHTNYGSRSIGFTAHQISDTTNNAEYSGGTFLDSPATTSATTYTVEGYAGSSTLYLNKANVDTDNSHSVRGISTLTLMEVAQ